MRREADGGNRNMVTHKDAMDEKQHTELMSADIGPIGATASVAVTRADMLEGEEQAQSGKPKLDATSSVGKGPLEMSNARNGTDVRANYGEAVHAALLEMNAATFPETTESLRQNINSLKATLSGKIDEYDTQVSGIKDEIEKVDLQIKDVLAGPALAEIRGRQRANFDKVIETEGLLKSLADRRSQYEAAFGVMSTGVGAAAGTLDTACGTLGLFPGDCSFAPDLSKALEDMKASKSAILDNQKEELVQQLDGLNLQTEALAAEEAAEVSKIERAVADLEGTKAGMLNTLKEAAQSHAEALEDLIAGASDDSAALKNLIDELMEDVAQHRNGVVQAMDAKATAVEQELAESSSTVHEQLSTLSNAKVTKDGSAASSGSPSSSKSQVRHTGYCVAEDISKTNCKAAVGAVAEATAETCSAKSDGCSFKTVDYVEISGTEGNPCPVTTDGNLKITATSCSGLDVGQTVAQMWQGNDPATSAVVPTWWATLVTLQDGYLVAVTNS